MCTENLSWILLTLGVKTHVCTCKAPRILPVLGGIAHMWVRGSTLGSSRGCLGKKHVFFRGSLRECCRCGGRTHVGVREGVRGSCRFLDGRRTCTYMEVLSDVGRDDPSLFTWNRPRFPSMWGGRTHVCVRLSVRESLKMGRGTHVYIG